MVRMLIAGGFVLSQDMSIGDQANCDVLIEDGVIVAIRPGLADEVTDAEQIDARGTVVIPGFVDSHRHTWRPSFAAPSRRAPWTTISPP